MFKRILSGTVMQFFGMAVSFFDRFVVTAILLRYWGVSLFEDWSLLLAAVGMASIFNLGFHNYFGNAYLFAYEQKKYGLLKNTIKLAIYFNLVAFIIGGAVLLVTGFSESFTKTIGIASLDEKAAITIYLLLGLMILLNAASSSITELYRAQGQFGRGVFINALVVLFRSIAVAIIATLGAGPLIGALAFISLTLLFVFIVVPLDQKRSLRYCNYGTKIPTKGEFIEVWHGSKWYFAQSFPALLQFNLPILLIGNMKTSPGIVAAFIMSRTIINFARQILQNFSFVLSQEISRAYAKGEKDRVKDIYLASNRFICTITGALLGCLLALAQPFFMIWSGGTVDYHPNLMVIFALTVGLAAPAASSVAFLFYIQEARPIALGRTAQTIITIVLAVVLVKPYGVVGVALAIMAGEVIGLSVFVLPAGARASGASLWGFVNTSILYLIVGFVPCISAGLVIQTYISQGSVAGLIVAIVLLSLIFVVVSLSSLSKSHRALLWKKVDAWRLKTVQDNDIIN